MLHDRVYPFTLIRPCPPCHLVVCVAKDILYCFIGVSIDRFELGPLRSLYHADDCPFVKYYVQATSQILDQLALTHGQADKSDSLHRLDEPDLSALQSSSQRAMPASLHVNGHVVLAIFATLKLTTGVDDVFCT